MGHAIPWPLKSATYDVKFPENRVNFAQIKGRQYWRPEGGTNRYLFVGAGDDRHLRRRLRDHRTVTHDAIVMSEGEDATVRRNNAT